MWCLRLIVYGLHYNADSLPYYYSSYDNSLLERSSYADGARTMVERDRGMGEPFHGCAGGFCFGNVSL